jgi:hypothetical protein
MNMKKIEKYPLFQKRTQRYAETGQLSKKMLKKIEKKPQPNTVSSRSPKTSFSQHQNTESLLLPLPKKNYDTHSRPLYP